LNLSEVIFVFQYKSFLQLLHLYILAYVAIDFGKNSVGRTCIKLQIIGCCMSPENI
jgi:hypothetical protein